MDEYGKNVVPFNADDAKRQLQKWAPKLPWAVLFLVLLFFGAMPSTGIWYTVDSDEAGVVKTFGRVSDQVGAGLHFKLPYPVQTVHITPLTRVLRFEYGYRTRDAGGGGRQPEYEYVQEFMLTQDENILDNQYAVQFRVKDPVRWVLAAEDIESLIYHTARAAMSQVVGEHSIDDALTEQKTEIQLEVQKLVQKTLDQYEAGIVVTGVKFQNPSPPPEVQDAFDDVQSAKEEGQTLVNNAEARLSQRVNEAKGTAAAKLEEAKAYRYSVIQEAQGKANRFLAILSEYESAPDVTEKRLYYELMGEILPQIEHVYFVDGSGSVLKHLPLEPFQMPGGER